MSGGQKNQKQTKAKAAEQVDVQDIEKEIQDLQLVAGSLGDKNEALKKENGDLKARNISLEAEIDELKEKLEKSKASKVKFVDNNVITDIKKLDKNKKYVSGPNGIGYVEVK